MIKLENLSINHGSVALTLLLNGPELANLMSGSTARSEKSMTASLVIVLMKETTIITALLYHCHVGELVIHLRRDAESNGLRSPGKLTTPHDMHLEATNLGKHCKANGSLGSHFR